MDAKKQAALKAVDAAFAWQAAQVAHLDGTAMDDDVAHWPSEQVKRLITQSGILFSSSELDKLVRQPEELMRTAVDLAAVLRVFQYTFANMPDEEEAREISERDNLAKGFPPPSQAPLAPSAAPPPGGGGGGSEGGDEPPGPAPKKKKGRRRPRDEL